MELTIHASLDSTLEGAAALGAISLGLMVLSSVVSLMAIVAFFSMAINLSKIRKELELVRDVVEVQYRESRRAITPPGAGGEPTARRF